jgi:hypothetical protein
MAFIKAGASPWPSAHNSCEDASWWNHPLSRREILRWHPVSLVSIRGRVEKDGLQIVCKASSSPPISVSGMPLPTFFKWRRRHRSSGTEKLRNLAPSSFIQTTNLFEIRASPVHELSRFSPNYSTAETTSLFHTSVDGCPKRLGPHCRKHVTWCPGRGSPFRPCLQSRVLGSPRKCSPAVVKSLQPMEELDLVGILGEYFTSSLLHPLRGQCFTETSRPLESLIYGHRISIFSGFRRTICTKETAHNRRLDTKYWTAHFDRHCRNSSPGYNKYEERVNWCIGERDRHFQHLM